MSMTARERTLLWFSVALSIGIWSLLYGPLLGVIFTSSLLFHEYGHYYWMGRERIKDKTMVMMPPLGAMATSREPFPSLGAEARIGLAGPGFGLVSVVVVFLISRLYGNYPSLSMAVWLICWVNLLNLCIPIAVLDGGRVIKPLLLSFNTRLGIGFYYFSFGILFFLVGMYLSIFTVMIGYVLLLALHSELQFTKEDVASGDLHKMSKREAFVSVVSFALIASGLYAIMLINKVHYVDFVKFVTT